MREQLQHLLTERDSFLSERLDLTTTINIIKQEHSLALSHKDQQLQSTRTQLDSLKTQLTQATTANTLSHQLTSKLAILSEAYQQSQAQVMQQDLHIRVLMEQFNAVNGDKERAMQVSEMREQIGRERDVYR